MASLPDVRSVRIAVGRDAIDADVTIPPSPAGVVVFAHGSGSSRRSPRNTEVARQLQSHHLATVLADLLTPAEEAVDRDTAEFRFDIERLGRRTVAVIDWVRSDSTLADLPLGLFGASTGAAAALVAAFHRPDAVAAVVSRGGRPDLAGPVLHGVSAPTLLLVGGLDTEVIALNRAAEATIGGRARLEIVPGATHLFEEPGTLDHVARRAAEWFGEWLGSR